MSLFGEDEDDAGSPNLFGSPPRDDLWGLTHAKPTALWSQQESLRTVLAGCSIPTAYDSFFNDGTVDGATVSVAYLEAILAKASISLASANAITSIVSSNGANGSLDKNAWYVAMALIGLAQSGHTDLDLDAVDFVRNDLPPVKLSFGKVKAAKGHALQNNTMNTSWGAESYGEGIPPSPAMDSTQEDVPATEVWTGTDPNTYNPSSKDAITVRLAPEKEGVFIFRHVVYILEGSTSFSDTSAPSVFKVVRRYSNFLWLQSFLLKKYPFRLLPVLPPKRLTVDGPPLERRRRGLSRFINQLVKHPVLRKERLVMMFLTIDSDPSIWQKQAGVRIEEEFTQRLISPVFVSSWHAEGEAKRWKDVERNVDEALEAVAQACYITDRIARRQEAMSADYEKLSQTFTSFNRNLPAMYFQNTGDIPSISAGVGAASKYTSTSYLLARDESLSLDVGVLEDLKQLREFLTSIKELFSRYEKIGGNRIDELQRRVDQNLYKLETLHTREDPRDGEAAKLRESIERGKRIIEQQKNRDWLIKECITEEIALFQRTQYQMSKNWSLDNVKYAELNAENWIAFNNDVSELPL